MATWDLIFDASAYLYPQYGGGLKELTEEVTLSNFISSFATLNNSIEFTPEQLQDCWFHALDYEYQQIMSTKALMTEEEIEITEQLLSQGMQQGTIFNGPDTEWDVAEYTPPVKAPEVASQRQRKDKRKSLPKKSNKYDPQLLLQSMPEIRAQAERFYQDGLEKFQSQGLRAQDPNVVFSYKNSCVSQAEEYVTCLLIDKYRKDEHEGEERFSPYEDRQIKNPSRQYKWKRDPKWKPVWRQMKAARKRMISEVGTNPLIEQDAVMDTDDITQNLNSGRSCSRKAISHTSEVSEFFRTVDTIEYRSVLRIVREGKLLGDDRVVEEAKETERSEKTKRELRLAKARHRYTGLETAIENFSLSPAKEVLNVVNQKRRKRKVAARTRDKTEKNKLLNMGRTFSNEKSSTSFSGGAQSTSVTGYPGSVGFPIKQEYMHSNILAPGSNSTANQSFPFPSMAPGSTQCSSNLPQGAEIKIENQDFPTSYRAGETFTATPTPTGESDAWSITTRSKTRASIMRTQTQDMPNLKKEQMDREPSEMDVEISDKISELKIKK